MSCDLVQLAGKNSYILAVVNHIDLIDQNCILLRSYLLCKHASVLNHLICASVLLFFSFICDVIALLRTFNDQYCFKLSRCVNQAFSSSEPPELLHVGVPCTALSAIHILCIPNWQFWVFPCKGN